jgi:Helix-turn-helix domain, rpiR family
LDLDAMSRHDFTPGAAALRGDPRAGLVPLALGAPLPSGQALVRRVEADLPHLSPKLRNVALYLVRESAQLHRQRIKDVALRADTVPVTIVRLAKRYGFQGFHDLKLAFLESGPLGDAAPAAAPSRCGSPETQAAQGALQGALHAIDALRHVLLHPAFERAVHWLQAAPRVWVSAATEGDEPVAAFLVQRLRRAGIDTHAWPLASRAMRTLAVPDAVHLRVAVAAGLGRSMDAVDAMPLPVVERTVEFVRTASPAIVRSIARGGTCPTLALAVEGASVDDAVAAGLTLAAACAAAVQAARLRQA